MTHLDRFDTAMKDYEAGELNFLGLMHFANLAQTENPLYVADALQRFKMRKSSAEGPVSDSEPEQEPVTPELPPVGAGSQEGKPVPNPVCFHANQPEDQRKDIGICPRCNPAGYEAWRAKQGRPTSPEDAP